MIMNSLFGGYRRILRKGKNHQTVKTEIDAEFDDLSIETNRRFSRYINADIPTKYHHDLGVNNIS